MQDKYKSWKCVNYTIQVNANRQHASPSPYPGNPLIPIPLPQAKFVVQMSHSWIRNAWEGEGEGENVAGENVDGYSIDSYIHVEHYHE
jgi:hypothetical protein